VALARAGAIPGILQADGGRVENFNGMAGFIELVK
jgi:hypothetical protein